MAVDSFSELNKTYSKYDPSRKNRKEYNSDKNLRGFMIFFFVLVFVLLLNLPLFLASLKLQGYSPIHYYDVMFSEERELVAQREQVKFLQDILQKKIDGGSNSSVLTMEEKELLGKHDHATLAEKNQVIQDQTLVLFQSYNDIYNDFDIIKSYCIGSSVTTFALFFGIIGVVKYKWKSHLVYTRGNAFLVHFGASAFLALLFGLLFSLIKLDRLGGLQYGTSTHTHVTYILGFFLIFFVNSSLSAIVNRMRLVFHCFCDLSLGQDYSNKKYFKVFPIYFIIFGISIICFTIDTYHEDATMVFVGFSLVFIVYAIWISFYTYYLRFCPSEFSDGISSLRATVFIAIIFPTVTILDNIFKNHMVGVIGYQYMVQTFILLYLLDSFFQVTFNSHNRNDYYRKTLFMSSKGSQKRTSSKNNSGNLIISNNFMRDIWDGIETDEEYTPEEIQIADEIGSGLHIESDTEYCDDYGYYPNDETDIHKDSNESSIVEESVFDEIVDV